RCRRELPADASRTFALPAHGTGQDDLAVLRPVLRARRNVEARLDASRRGAVADERAPRPGAQRERETDRYHGLAGAGLAREDVQTGMQFEVQVIDDP